MSARGMFRATLWALALIALVRCSSKPAHTLEDYQNATILATESVGYQDSDINEALLVVNATLQATNGDKLGPVPKRLVFDGSFHDPSGLCAFHVEDLAQNPLGKRRINRPCAARPIEIAFDVADNHYALIGHISSDPKLGGSPGADDMFVIDRFVEAPRNLVWHEGHEPSTQTRDVSTP